MVTIQIDRISVSDVLVLLWHIVLLPYKMMIPQLSLHSIVPNAEHSIIAPADKSFWGCKIYQQHPR
jgi:hypothetical protein